MANFCCPIELEPRTLRGEQLTHAREIAADVAQNSQPNDATIIFIEGLRPVGSTKKMKQIIEDEEEDIDDVKITGFREANADQCIDKPCQCTCEIATASTDSLEQARLIIREPLSAPF